MKFRMICRNFDGASNEYPVIGFFYSVSEGTNPLNANITVSMSTDSGLYQEKTFYDDDTGASLYTMRDRKEVRLKLLGFPTLNIEMDTAIEVTVTITSDTGEIPYFSLNFYKLNISGISKYMFITQRMTELCTPFIKFGRLPEYPEMKKTIFIDSTAEIPANLFKYNTHLTDLSYFFCDAGTITIPEKLFKGMTNVTNIVSLFESSDITSIPSDLLKWFNPANITSIDDLVSWSSITEIPAGLLDTLVYLVSAESAFEVTDITSIPAGLFDKNINLENVSTCFNVCDSLESIPVGLFKYNTKITDFEMTFRQVLAKVIHPNIFCDEATEKTTRFANVAPNFRQCFSSLKGTVQGTAPALWEYTYKSTPTKSGCFYGASATVLSNYSSISSEWI